MKKVKITVMALLMSVAVNAQMSLEKTFVENESIDRVITLSAGQKWYVYNQGGYELRNPDHSLFKVVTIPTVPGYGGKVLNISDNTFNGDSKIEYLCMYTKTGSGMEPYQYSKILRVVSETGEVIQNWYVNAEPIFYRIDGKSKMLINAYETDSIDKYIGTQMWSLPGDYVAISEASEELLEPAFPNPTSQQITLPYNLNGASAGVVKVYNLNGQVIETFNVGSAFNTLLLDVSGYPSGMYRYGVVVNGVETTASFVRE